MKALTRLLRAISLTYPYRLGRNHHLPLHTSQLNPIVSHRSSIDGRLCKMPPSISVPATRPASSLVSNGKRKTTTDDSLSIPATKKPKPTDKFSDRSRYKDSTLEERHGIVLREFYPPEMTNTRAKQYIAGGIERPIETLERAIAETSLGRQNIPVKESVVHWFKCDLRTKDNRGLHLASQKARGQGVPLIGLYLVSPQDFEAHLTSSVRVDFILRTLEVLKTDLAQLDIPLYVEVVEKRRRIPDRIMELCQSWGSSHIFCNTEYEVDELRREAALTRSCLQKNTAFTTVPDTCVVSPGELSSKSSGNQFAVYSPWFRAWCAYVNSHLAVLDEFPGPCKNPVSVRERFASLFDCRVPDAPKNKQLSAEEQERFRKMWPPGESEADQRLEKFVSQRVKKYAETRNLPAGNGTAVLSVHLAAGTLPARKCVREARNANSSRAIDSGNASIQSWISEVAWRDFYKHVLAHWPFICMNKSFKPDYTDIEWEYNPDHFRAWTDGKTGYPIVDAAMRQLNHTGYMHNRCRMIVASFLAKDLLIDWRMGERYFMEHLIDGDFASNNGGWGFSASTGVDPQPYFRIFNPLLQSEKFDADGEYIRKWVPELKGLKGGKNGAVHDPYGRGAEGEVKKSGYPRPVVEHKFARERALARYKEGLGRSSA